MFSILMVAVQGLVAVFGPRKRVKLLPGEGRVIAVVGAKHLSDEMVEVVWALAE